MCTSIACIKESLLSCLAEDMVVLELKAPSAVCTVILSMKEGQKMSFILVDCLLILSTTSSFGPLPKVICLLFSAELLVTQTYPLQENTTALFS